MNSTIHNSIPARQRYALAQFGVMSILGRIPIGDDRQLERGDWIVCQTGRGLELGMVRSLGTTTIENLNEPQDGISFAGQLIRMASDSDHMANSRLSTNKILGLEACAEWLAAAGHCDVLLDVDITLDGQRLYFHFLGQDENFDPAVNERLVEVYDQVTGIKRFTEAVAEGCGPDCGSDGGGCQTNGSCGTPSKSNGSGCSSCGLKSSCRK